jgi:hypothetical protein
MALRGIWDRLTTLLDAVGGLVGSFQESMVSADPLDLRGWGAYLSRMQRYRILWAMYENTTYSDVHAWAAPYRREYSLYRWTRNVYNPAYRLGEFHATHLMGGDLDPEVGDGSERSTALPILTDNPAVRAGLAQLWRDSDWQARKTRWCRWGSALGDVGLKVDDDVAADRVKLCPVSPSHIRHLDIDQYGDVQGYMLEYFRPDPEWTYTPDSASQPLVPYTEQVTRDGDDIRFRTYRSGRLYDWHDYPAGTPQEKRVGSDWTRPYGFVPFVTVQHIDQGLGWGWAEAFPAMSKIRECDDLGSILTDQARRILNSPWVLNSKKPAKPLFKKDNAQSQDEWAAQGDTTTIPTRDKMSLIWADPQWNGGRPITPVQLVGSMPIGEVLAAIGNILGQLEQDFPELALRGTESGDSGRARRIPRQQVEAKVHERRANYDAGLVRAQMMALSIGGMNRYRGYEGIDAGSYRRGDLAHRIDKRPVFAVEPMDEFEEEKAVVDCLQVARNADPALVPIVMRRLGGFTSADIAAVQASVDATALLTQLKATPATLPGQNPLGANGTHATQPPGEARNGSAAKA